MQPIPFMATSAEEAVVQIRAKLGPEAVVLNVRRLPPNGLARLWQKPMIEVLAYRPEMPALEPAPISETLAEFRQELNQIKQQVVKKPARLDLDIDFDAPPAIPDNVMPSYAFEPEESRSSDTWRIGPVLQKSGLLPLNAQRVLDQLHDEYGENPPPSLADEMALAQAVLQKSWRTPPRVPGRAVHILVGPAGSGKTTCLCKWLTQAVLMEGRRARVWRLDGSVSNTAESLSVYCDILGAPSERAWQTGDEAPPHDIGFIDLPGVDWRQPLAIKELAGQLKQFGSPRVHLVLNGAYDTSILLAQARAFSALPIEDLIVTHLDEEPRWGKLWNLILGTNFSVRYFSTGQNIPGDYSEASAQAVFARQFPKK